MLSLFKIFKDPSPCKFLGNYQSIVSKAAEWEKELKCDPDKTFLMEGIRNGFHFTDAGSQVQKVQVKNHKSAITPQNKPTVEREIKTQIEQGNYILVSKKLAIVIPVGAIPKADGSVQIIHDGSLHEGLAMNDYTDHHSVRHKTIQDACCMAKQGYYCAKLHLKSAYRSVLIHPDDYKATGRAWLFE